jgi:peptidyl-prolyl cis-trans isomerase SurA
MQLSAKVLNKVIANVENESLTLSEAKRARSTYKNKKTISPQIYNQDKISLNMIIDLFIKRYIIRFKLKEIGYEINDKQVEAQIKSTESRLGLNREDLLSFLKSNGLTFNEYFETTRESIEYNIFLGKVIKPLVKITDQEILNKYRTISKKDSLTFKYDLVDFYINKKSISNIDQKIIIKDLNLFKKTGILPGYLNNIENNLIKNVSEENLSSLIKNAVKKSSKNEFSKRVDIDDLSHFFFIKEKKLIESEKYRRQKPAISQKIFDKKSKNVIKTWISQKKNRYYISINL